MQRRVVMPPLFSGAACRRLLHRGKSTLAENGGNRRILMHALCTIVVHLACVGQNTMEAEGVRFELTRPFGPPVFKTGAINRSATPPENW